MMDQTSEKARQVMGLAFQQGQKDGCKTPETIHFLIGLALVNPEIFKELGISLEQVRRINRSRPRKKRPAPRLVGMMPFSDQVAMCFRRARKEAEQLGHRNTGTAHLLLGLFLEDLKLRSKLEKIGATETRIREVAAKEPQERVTSPEFMDSMRRNIGRSGIGYDLHRLEVGRKLRIGGIEIAFDKGSVGHSDGDVLAHAICDALLGAAGLGDIGTHFPDTDAKWKGADSLVFLKHVRELYEKVDLHILHIDAIVIAERPKLGPHFPAMREALAGALGITAKDINLKAKTNEGVDAIGRGEAIAAHAVATIAG